MQTSARVGANSESSAETRTSFTLPTGATLVDLNHEFGVDATSWIQTDLRSARRKTGSGTAEAGFMFAEGSAEPRGFGSDREDAFDEGDLSAARARQRRLRRVAAPLVVIDVCARAARDRDAELSVEELEAFERLSGAIEPGAAVLVRTCWYWRWANRDRYLGFTVLGPGPYHFPGVSWKAARALIERRVAAVAIDTAGVDHGPSTGDVVRRTLEQAGIQVFVNVVAYQALPTRGALLMALPIKLSGSEHTPMRLFALTP